ncbi:MAG TPA: nucleotidyltransferase family protein [Pyrinomonadaceae bacterium]
MSMPKLSAGRGTLMAALLAGAWRAEPQAAACTNKELELIAPLLIETGAAALAWRRLRHSGIAETPKAHQLHEVYRLNHLLSVMYRREVAEVFSLLRSHRIEPVLVKGWAIGRHYAEPEARPCGDVDLCVSNEQYRAAQDVLKSRTQAAHHADLHKGFRHLDKHGFEELKSRSELVELEGEPIRVLKPEDHLRVLCYHFLREGGWRPLWLCDISVALETRPRGFDWDLCLSGSGAVAGWVRCSLMLAHKLLGADLSVTPAAVRDTKLPQWLAPSILSQWEVRSMSLRHRAPVAGAVSYPLRTLKGLRHHWPTPVEATVSMGASFTELPRFPLQVGNVLTRAATLLARLPQVLRDER